MKHDVKKAKIEKDNFFKDYFNKVHEEQIV